MLPKSFEISGFGWDISEICGEKFDIIRIQVRFFESAQRKTTFEIGQCHNNEKRTTENKFGD